ncbi:MAG: ATP-grasp domain-containing protein [Candidatus Omnitrophota bacterium]|nr:ATP-grasp domain-containing protein [Candidatus Omnitrophota bacterium]
MGKVVGLTFDLKTDYKFKQGDPRDANAEFDSPSTIGVIAKAIERGGHKVIKIGNVHNLLDKLDELKVDIVFNISEGLYGRNRESQVPVILEMKGIPYVGSDGLTLALTLDKLLTKKIFLAEKIPTPRFMEAKDGDTLDDLDHLKFPLIVKPRYEGSSKGLSDASRVENMDDFKKQVDFIVNTYHQPALVEEFISGSEYTVAIIGNEEPQVLPVVQIKIDGKLKLEDRFYTFARIHSRRLEYVCPARISKELNTIIQELALKSYQVLECRDLGRVDFRVDNSGRPFVLEVNPLPSLSSADVLNPIAKQMDKTYEELINRILNSALERYHLN